MIELKFAPQQISLGFDGIIHSHHKKPETMTHIPFPITLMGSECASSEGTRSKGKAQMVTLPDHIDNSLSIAVVEVSDFVFRVFCLMITICSVTYHELFSMIFDLFGYPQAL